MRDKHFFRLIQQCSAKYRQMGLLVLSVLLSLVALQLLALQSFPAHTVAASTPKEATLGGQKTPLEPHTLPPARIAPQDTITTYLDIMIAFDVSGSMEYETICYDCWTRFDPTNHDYPNNGYFNPLPFNPAWAETDGDGQPIDQSIPHSDLCQAPPEADGSSGNRYLSHEAELYSREQGNWHLNARTPGQGFWVIQRGSRNINNIFNPAEDGDGQGNQAGNAANQSSNVCNPGIAGNGINCTVSGQNICDTDVVGHPVDCSAYIKAHPFPTYSQAQDSNPHLQGAAYDITCLTTGDRCWANNALEDESRPNKNTIPFVEYDFTPRWEGDTHVWIRALGGGDRAYQWNGASPNTLFAWRKAVLWEVYERQDGALVKSPAQHEGTGGLKEAGDWRDNRADDDDWVWIKLGTVSTDENTQHRLRIYQGSAGYKIDKIVFTEEGGIPSVLSDNDGKGPPATNGSATRESCNICNPAYGYVVNPGNCGCPINSVEANAYITTFDDGDPDTTAYGSGNSCTNIAQEANMLENDLYSGLQPLRSAQEAVKNFANRLDTGFDQLGLVAFETNLVSDDSRRTKLQCQRTDPTNCENNEDRFVQVSRAVENQWPQAGTNISAGLREGLTQLGVPPFATDNDCNAGDDRSACARSGAQRVLILITDGVPNNKAGSYCRPNSIDPFTGETIVDLWNGDVAPNDSNFECAAHYAKEAAQADVDLYTIGIGPGINSDFLTLLAEGRDPHSETGGPEAVMFSARCGRYYQASTPADLDPIFAAIETNSRNCAVQSITDITLTGPEEGLTDVSHTFTAAIEPATAAQPVTYTRQATGQTPITHTNGLSDTVTFTWDTPGTKTITVTAANAVSSVSTAHTIEITTTPVPPGCEQLLAESGFETVPLQKWFLPSSEGVFIGISVLQSHTGLYRLVAPTFGSNYNNPYFYQQVTLPAGISTTTTLISTLYVDVDSIGSDDPDDQFFVALTTTPDPATRITEPLLVAQGIGTTDWERVDLTFSPTSGVDFADYAGQAVYLYFYNNSNLECDFAGGEGCHETEYSFDDVLLNVCEVTIYLPVILK